MNELEQLAERLFPAAEKTPEEIEQEYPERNLPEGAVVTRFAPSPTGFLHIGGLFAAMIAKTTARQSGGVFFLRIEDTDKKREIENGVGAVIEGLKAFGVAFDEGVTGEGGEKGAYGPYFQSRRKGIYQSFAKKLFLEGLAYPCFCSPEQLDEIRTGQERDKLRTGYYGPYARCRALSFEEIERRLEEGRPFVIRLKSPGSEENRFSFRDLVKGKIEMPENDQDIVLLKADGIPTYHFAHAVDDHLMRTTLVVRGDEWISSVPIHLQLFRLLQFRAPKYAHISPIMKEENGGKRKLSKRKDPEAAVTFYHEEGYPRQSVMEYLMTLANSVFEDWRRANPKAPVSEYPFKLSKMSLSGALFDLVKLNDVSKNTICFFPAEQVRDEVTAWAKQYRPRLAALLERDPDYAAAIFSIDREGKKPRKDIARWSEVEDYVSYFYDELWDGRQEKPENIAPEDAAAVLKRYLEAYDPADDKDEWFRKIKELCGNLGFAGEVKAYKQSPESYKGHVGDVSGIIRIAATGRKNTPDLYEILRLLGAERFQMRAEKFIKQLEEEVSVERND